MSELKAFRPYPQNGTITLANGAVHILHVGGNFINVKSANTGFTIRLDDKYDLAAAQNRRFKMDQGQEFEKIEIVNDSGGSLTFQIEAGYGSVESDDVSISGTLKTSGGGSASYGTQTIGTSQSQVFAANSDRTSWTIQNKGTAAIYIGDDSSVTTANGLEIPVGGIYGEDSQGAIHAISGSAGQDIRYREVST